MLTRTDQLSCGYSLTRLDMCLITLDRQTIGLFMSDSHDKFGHIFDWQNTKKNNVFLMSCKHTECLYMLTAWCWLVQVILHSIAKKHLVELTETLTKWQICTRHRRLIYLCTAQHELITTRGPRRSWISLVSLSCAIMGVLWIWIAWLI